MTLNLAVPSPLPLSSNLQHLFQPQPHTEEQREEAGMRRQVNHRTHSLHYLWGQGLGVRGEGRSQLWEQICRPRQPWCSPETRTSVAGPRDARRPAGGDAGGRLGRGLPWLQQQAEAVSLGLFPQH